MSARVSVAVLKVNLEVRFRTNAADCNIVKRGGSQAIPFVKVVRAERRKSPEWLKSSDSWESTVWRDTEIFAIETHICSCDLLLLSLTISFIIIALECVFPLWVYDAGVLGNSYFYRSVYTIYRNNIYCTTTVLLFCTSPTLIHPLYFRLSLSFSLPAKCISSLSRNGVVLFHIKGIAEINMGLEDLNDLKSFILPDCHLWNPSFRL